MNAEQGKSNPNQLVEIYKLHAQLVSDLSNRQSTINRFYPTLMSGLIALFFGFLQRTDMIIPKEVDEKTIIAMSTVAVGYFGLLLSMIWFLSIRYYYRVISRKYEILKNLETKLEFQFFAEEWRLLNENKKNILYRRFSFFELVTPYAFMLAFMGLIFLGMFNLVNIS